MANSVEVLEEGLKDLLDNKSLSDSQKMVATYFYHAGFLRGVEHAARQLGVNL